MKMPIDVVSILSSAMDVKSAQETPISVSVLLDETAPADVVAFTRSSFASAAPQARVSITYFHDGNALIDTNSDMAVIAAGTTSQVGELAASVRASGMPCMVVTSQPLTVGRKASEQGFAIPEGDLVAPDVKDGDVVMFDEPITITKDSRPDTTRFDGSDPAALEPFTLTDERKQALSNRMGSWVVAVFPHKKLAFAQAFEFVRRPLADEAVAATSAENAGVGVVEFIPGADLPIMTANQAKMVLQIAAAYGQEVSPERARELVAVVAGGFALRGIARQIVALVPAIGWVVKGIIGYTGTKAMGEAAIGYFEHGGNVAGVAGVVEDVSKSVMAAVNTVIENAQAADSVQDLLRQVGVEAVSRVGKAAQTAPERAGKAVADAKKAAEVVVSGALSAFDYTTAR